MYIVFTEEQGKSIRNKYGVSVIEYKRCIKCTLKISRMSMEDVQAGDMNL